MCIALHTCEAAVAPRASSPNPPVVRPALQQEWFTLQEVEQLGFPTYATLRRYIADGVLVAHKIGGRVRVHRDALDALPQRINLREREVESVEAAIDRIVAAAPALSDEQCRRLAAAFGGAS
ncbi:helix-turn-helix domain-containing protein [Ammonicoccus fulvus]|uniref:Helix-turn-helix domain-containing protein n=1 Tax=Ammonicoccus fulvus TaxID=3138240 RepID=A0ABZ3FSZ1_9ACTN